MSGITLTEDGGDIQLHIPMTMKKRGGRKEIIVPEGLQSRTPPRPIYHEALVIAVARAHRWKDMLESGKYGSIIELAAAIKTDRSYVSRLLKLTLLAPDMLEAIMDGWEPSGFAISRLAGAVPMDWDEQRRKYGFGYFGIER